MLDAGDDLEVGGKAAGLATAEDPITNRYHKPQDEYVATCNWDGAAQSLEMFCGIGRELADASAWPNWAPPAAFGAVRDKSRAGN